MGRAYDTFPVAITPKAMLLLRDLIEADLLNDAAPGFEQAQLELENLSNELRARLQRIARGE